jgi:hypothetical protein
MKTLQSLRAELLAQEREPEDFILEYEAKNSVHPFVEDLVERKGVLDIDYSAAVLRDDVYSIYLAGKIYKNCWRHSIVKDLRSYEPMIEQRIYQGIKDKHTYTGPFFDSCDHGCAHTADAGYSHGQVSCNNEGKTTRRSIKNHCLTAITDSDLVFAWIDSTTCYGTLFELGFARRIPVGLKIVIGVPRMGFIGIEDLWFIFESANIIVCADTPQEAFAKIPL